MACKRSAVRSRLPPPTSETPTPSSRGLGHRPFTAVTGVRIPVGSPTHKRSSRRARRRGVRPAGRRSCGVVVVAGQVHVFGHVRRLQSIQQPPDPVGALRRDAATVARLKEPPQALVPEGSDHRPLSRMALHCNVRRDRLSSAMAQSPAYGRHRRVGFVCRVTAICGRIAGLACAQHGGRPPGRGVAKRTRHIAVCLQGAPAPARGMLRMPC